MLIHSSELYSNHYYIHCSYKAYMKTESGLTSLYTSAALPRSFEGSYTSCILTLLFPRTIVTYIKNTYLMRLCIKDYVI